MDSFQLVIRDDHEEGEKGLLDCKQVIASWIPFKGEEGVVSLFDGRVIASGFILVDCCRELLANKGSIFLGKRSWTGAVEDWDDDNQSNSVGKGKLRVLGAFGEFSKSIGSREDGNGGPSSLIGIKFKLISIAVSSKMGRKWRRIGLGMKKSSIGGNQNLDYLQELLWLSRYI
jgi:hypothetical protein